MCKTTLFSSSPWYVFHHLVSIFACQEGRNEVRSFRGNSPLPRLVSAAAATAATAATAAAATMHVHADALWLGAFNNAIDGAALLPRSAATTTMRVRKDGVWVGAQQHNR